MDISRSSKIIILLFALSLFSCGTQKHTTNTTEKRYERQEIITKQLPFEFTVSEKIKFDKAGYIKPIELKIKHNNAEGIVTIKDDVVSYTIQSKDTIITSKEVKEKEVIDTKNDTVITDTAKNPTSFWGKVRKFGRKVMWWSLLLNVVFIARVVIKISRRFYMPF